MTISLALFVYAGVTAVTVVVTAANETEVHVAQRGNNLPPVLVFDRAGRLLRTWGGGGAIVTPHGLTTGLGSPATIWVSDIGDATVKQFDLAGNLLAKIGVSLTPGSGLDPVQFSSIADVALTPWGDVVTVDGDAGVNNRMLGLAGRGDNWRVLYDVGGNGSAPGQFNSPHSIVYAGATRSLLVADRYNNRLQGMDARSGVVTGAWSNACFGGGQPWGLRLDEGRGRLLLADGLNGRLLALAYPLGAQGDCALLQSIDVCASCKPHELGVDTATGDVYLAGVGTPPAMQRYILV